ncbi:invasion associated locus B family protein [Pseudomonas lini]
MILEEKMKTNSYVRHLAGLVAVVGGLCLSSASAFAQEANTQADAALSVKENHDDWLVACAAPAKDGGNAKVCTLSQEQLDSGSHLRTVAIELKPSAAGVQGVLFLPFGLALDQGAELQIDDGAAIAPKQKIQTCLPVGCVAPIKLDEKMLAALRKGTALKVKVVAGGGNPALFNISLKGFAEAFDRTSTLSK